MTDPAKEKMNAEGDLWSWLRNVLQQGGAIWQDYVDDDYEKYSARLDEAARERLDELGQRLATFDELRRLQAENARMRQAIVTATSKLETQRIWNGTGWHYNSLPPLYYKPALEVLINALR